MKSNKHRSDGFISWKLIVLLFLVSVVVGFAVWRAVLITRAMSVVAGSMNDLQQAKSEDKSKIVIEVDEVTQEGSIHGRLLQKKTEEIYTRTNTAIAAQVNPEIKFIMGQREDKKKSAVIHVTGTLRSNRNAVTIAIDAQQIVILTAYVKVQ
jgi:hypothetical protein